MGQKPMTEPVILSANAQAGIKSCLMKLDDCGLTSEDFNCQFEVVVKEIMSSDCG